MQLVVVAVPGVSCSSHTTPTAMHLASAQYPCCGIPRAAFVSTGLASCSRNFLTTSSSSSFSSGCKRSRQHDASSRQGGAGAWHTARHRPCVPSHGTTRERKYHSLLISLAQKQTVAWDAGAAEALAKAGEESESGSDASGSSHRHRHHPPLGLKEERRRAPLSPPPPTPKVVVESREVREGNRCATTDAEESTADAAAAIEGNAQLGGRTGLEGGHGTGEHRLCASAGDHLLGPGQDVDADDPADAATAVAAATAASVGVATGGGGGTAASASAASAAAAAPATATAATATAATIAAATAATATTAAATAVTADDGEAEVVDEAEAERRAAARRVVRARRQRDRRRKERATLAAKKALVKKVNLVHYVRLSCSRIIGTLDGNCEPRVHVYWYEVGA